MKGVRSRIIPFPKVGRWVVKRVHAIAGDTDKIRWTKHARERIREREITSRQVLEVLRRGRGVGPAQREEGEWKIILEKPQAGREIRVVVTMEGHDELTVVTVW